MSGVSPVVTNVIPIIPSPLASADGTSYVPGFVLALTVFILGSILMLIMISYIFMIVFGQPMAVAKTTATQGSIIQHFNTSKSAVMKDATIAGGAFRYKSIRDGTVAATVGSVNNIRGRQMVITFAQLGVTIPIPILGGISILVHNGINNIAELRNKITKINVYRDKRFNPKTQQEEEYEVREEVIKNEEIISGYDFENFDNLLKQSEEEKLIPLVIEAVPDFVERNINADYTEKKIKIRQILNTKGEENNDYMKIMTITIAVVIIFIIGMFIK